MVFIHSRGTFLLFSFIFYNWEVKEAVLEGEDVGVTRFDLVVECFIYADDFIVNFFVFKAKGYIIAAVTSCSSAIK